MGTLLKTYIFPHPPIAIPDIGGKESRKVQQTIDACKAAAQEIERLKPSTIIIITPHGATFQDAVCISTEPKLIGSFADFGHSTIHHSFNNDTELGSRIIQNTKEQNINIGQLDKEFADLYGISNQLDHGALVPLHFIQQYANNFKVIHINMGFLPFQQLYTFGTCIAKAIEESDKDVVIIASGDLSHRLSVNAPAGYNPRGQEYDKLLVNHIENSDVEKILAMDKGLIQDAGECGIRSFIIMYGALDGKKIESKVLSYEGPFGVGYCVAAIQPKLSMESRSIAQIIFEKSKKEIDNIRKQESVYASLARKTLELYVREGKLLTVKQINLPDEILNRRAGVFVSIKKHGELRGCIGTIEPTCKNIAEEIINNAISAGTKDYRFNPVEEHELEDLVYSVDILGKAEAISSIRELDTTRYGIIVNKGLKRGLLLPNLEGVNTVEEQISIALRKAGIDKDEEYFMERFEVTRYK